MTRFVNRTSGTAISDVVVDRLAAELMPEAMRHVASSVFEEEDDERDLLRDAALSVERALASQAGPRVSFGLSAEEAAHVPECLRHVAREIFRDEPKVGPRKERALNDAAEAVVAAFPRPPGPSR